MSALHTHLTHAQHAQRTHHAYNTARLVSNHLAIWLHTPASLAPRSRAMRMSVSLHPKGLSPFEAAKAWHLREVEKLPWLAVRKQVRTLDGGQPRRYAVVDAVKRISAQRHTAAFRRTGVATTAYRNCGRKHVLTVRQRSAIVAFVKQWRHKRFCTASYIVQELRLSCNKKAVIRALNAAGYTWRAVSKQGKLTDAQIAARKAFVDAHIGKSAAWWRQQLGLVLDGVTLTKAPKPMSQREKHAAQAIKHMWVKKGEAMDNNLHTHNRYGVQLGEKVPLWGGFNGNGRFSLKLWTERPKLDKAVWAHHIARGVKRAASGRNVWHDNEQFLKQPAIYAQHGLSMKCFPPNSGDLNPIETVWAWLRKELAKKDMNDCDEGRTLTVSEFRRRVGQILHSFEVRKPRERLSRLEKLINGMPQRMANCRANRYGKCGK